MRTWTTILGGTALATAGVLWTTHAPPADAQQPTAVGVPATTSDVVFVSGSVDFGDTKGTEASKSVTVSIPGRAVMAADVMLKGYELEFIKAEHPVHALKVKLDNVQPAGEGVKFDAKLFVRDNSGEFDDAYRGKLDYVVIARVR